jgi:hypothetical protein
MEKTETKQAVIVVAQTYEDVLDDIKSDISPENPHKIIYASTPADALEASMQNPVDLLVTGSCFYHTDIQSLGEAIAVYTAGPFEASKHFWPKRGGHMSGGDIAVASRKIRPDILVLRYSTTPDENPYRFGINGDIDKISNPDSLINLLDDPELKQIIDRKDWGALKQRHSEIRFYDNFPRGGS